VFKVFHWLTRRLRDQPGLRGGDQKLPLVSIRLQVLLEDLPTSDQPKRWQFSMPDRMVLADYQGQWTPAQEAGQVVSWVGALRDSLSWQDQERRDIEGLLGSFLTQLWSTVRELKKEKDEKVIRIHELEEKRSTLDSEYQDIFQENNQLKQEEKALKKEAELLQQDLDQIRQDCF
jgi:hypothetical protein